MLNTCKIDGSERRSKMFKALQNSHELTSLRAITGVDTFELANNEIACGQTQW